jgi:small conductance mechanosensitive channel
MSDILMDYIVPIATAFVIASILQWLFRRIFRQMIQVNHLVPENLRLRRERQSTLYGLVTSGFSLLAYLIACLFTVSLFIDSTTIIWMIGLFSAGFGIGAHGIIRDLMSGVIFIFEDTIDVGDKVEVLEIEGVVESINLRTTFIRANTGELYIVPNGDIRVIRNFSRGSFSTTTITISVSTDNLEEALSLLEPLATEAMEIMPNLTEPWKVISTSAMVGHTTELMLFVKTRYGKAAESRPRLIQFLRDHLSEAGIEIVTDPSQRTQPVQMSGIVRE